MKAAIGTPLVAGNARGARNCATSICSVHMPVNPLAWEDDLLGRESRHLHGCGNARCTSGDQHQEQSWSIAAEQFTFATEQEPLIDLCDGCGEWFGISDLIWHDGYLLCRNCLKYFATGGVEGHATRRNLRVADRNPLETAMPNHGRFMVCAELESWRKGRASSRYQARPGCDSIYEVNQQSRCVRFHETMGCELEQPQRTISSAFSNIQLASRYAGGAGAIPAALTNLQPMAATSARSHSTKPIMPECFSGRDGGIKAEPCNDKATPHASSSVKKSAAIHFPPVTQNTLVSCEVTVLLPARVMEAARN